ncbi:MAG: class I SAM-dependent methyltransferase [Patescibacteria group bacterium]|jgi:23S rRNA (cytosine1962-C5)-methyltransferase
MSEYKIITTEPGKDYELVDSGESEKLERYADVLIARPDPQALWPKKLSVAEWEKANAFFKRVSVSANWSTKGKIAEKWQVEIGGLKMWVKLSAFKHTGIFPEQVGNWLWLEEKIKNSGRPVSVLNLFGYTGGATLACAKAGAEVCHVDGSKAAIGWGRENAEISGLKDKPIRWILDDAFRFVQREVKRGKLYDGIIMDPPSFGHGPKGELWKIEKSFLPFVEECKKVLSKQPLFFLINGYAAGYSALAYKNNLETLFKAYGGKVEVGELTIKEKEGERLLPAGIFARWSSV